MSDLLGQAITRAEAIEAAESRFFHAPGMEIDPEILALATNIDQLAFTADKAGKLLVGRWQEDYEYNWQFSQQPAIGSENAAARVAFIDTLVTGREQFKQAELILPVVGSRLADELVDRFDAAGAMARRMNKRSYYRDGFGRGGKWLCGLPDNPTGKYVYFNRPGTIDESDARTANVVDYGNLIADWSIHSALARATV